MKSSSRSEEEGRAGQGRRGSNASRVPPIAIPTAASRYARDAVLGLQPAMRRSRAGAPSARDSLQSRARDP